MRATRRLAIPVLLALGGIGLALAGLAITLSADEHAFVRNVHASGLSYFGSLLSLLSLGWFASAIHLDGPPRPRVAAATGLLTAATGLAFAIVPFVQSYSGDRNSFEQSAWRGVATALLIGALGWFLLSRPLAARLATLAGVALALTAFAFGLTGIIELYGGGFEEEHGYDWLALGFDLAILASAARAAARPSADAGGVIRIRAY